MNIRINRYIASCGICSRRKAEEYIKARKVEVNGNVISDLSYKVDTELDKVSISGTLISKEDEKIYLMLNKPVGYVTTNSEQFCRKSTSDLIHENVRVFPIGRLDMYTEGLLLFTNDGDFANMLTHPRHNISKTYLVETNSIITDEKIESLRNGVDIGGYVTKKANVKKISNNVLEITITEGKNRQIRKMCEATNIKIKKLKRIKIGNLTLGNLKIGEYRRLTIKEIDNLKKLS